MAAGEGVAASLLSPPLTPSTAPLRGLPAPRPSQKGSVGSAAAPQDADVGCCPALRPPRCRGGAGDATGRREGTATQMGTRRPHISQQGGQCWPQIHPPPPPHPRGTRGRALHAGGHVCPTHDVLGALHTHRRGALGMCPPLHSQTLAHTPCTALGSASPLHTHTHRGGSPPCTHTIGAPILCSPPPFCPHPSHALTLALLSHTHPAPPALQIPPQPILLLLTPMENPLQ